MIGHYYPEAFSVLDKPATTSYFPFRSTNNPFCVGDRVQIDPDLHKNEYTIKNLEPLEDVKKVTNITT